MSLRIVAAANRKDGCVFTGAHHHLILWQMSCCGAGKGGEQGFLASDGRFVDRKEARIIAQAANTVHEPQVRQKTPDKNSL